MWKAAHGTATSWITIRAKVEGLTAAKFENSDRCKVDSRDCCDGWCGTKFYYLCGDMFSRHSRPDRESLQRNEVTFPHCHPEERSDVRIYINEKLYII